MTFLEELSSPTVLRFAWDHVAAKGGVPGIDRVTIADFGADLEKNIQTLSHEIDTRSYRALPVLRIRPPFLAASDRALVVPTVRDRLVQRAVAELLAPRIEPTLSPSCRAFRKGFSAVSTAADVGRAIESGRAWVLRADVRHFFDGIRPQLLHEMLEPFVDEDGLRFLDRILRCRIFDHDQVSEMIIGIPQGSPLSPLLSNLYLRDVDRTLAESYSDYLRYCDDMIVLDSSEPRVREAAEELGRALEPLGLELNQDKTRICRAEDGFVFLGYHFGPVGRGPAVKAVEALECRLAELTAAEEPDALEIDAVYRGWTNYFGHHPECWTSSPAGILALLRARGLPDAENVRRRLAEARWKTSYDAPPRLALELAKAWTAAGLEEQAWLEMATACSGSRSDLPRVEEWAHVLGAEPKDLSSLARRLVGPAEDRLTVLTEAMAEIGSYKLANRVAAAAPEYTAPPARDSDSPKVRDLAAEADTRLLLEWFQGREGVHATEALDRAGHRSFVPVHRPIAPEDWVDHLAGERTLALPLVRSGDTVFLGVFDVDIERKALDERLGIPDDLLGRALGTARRLRQELQQRGCSSLLEASGHKGYHVWVRFEDPLPCFRVRRWMLDVIRSIEPLPEGIRIEELPNRDRVKPAAVGPLVKLPLGVHSKTGKHCALLDDAGEALSDPFEVIRSLPRVTPGVVNEVEVVSQQASPDIDDIGPRARRMLDGCHVLRFLAKKASATSYLDHRERSTLLYTLGHLGEEGRKALHAIISKTYNYRRETTDRHIEHLPPWPISCPKIRELHPQALQSGACKCQFDIRGKGYPTPLLFALRASEVPVFRKMTPKAKGAAKAKTETEEVPLADKVHELHKHVEEKVRKIAELKRHRRGIDASIDRIHQELSALLDEAKSETIQLSIGLLKRIKQTDADGWDFVIEV